MRAQIKRELKSTTKKQDEFRTVATWLPIFTGFYNTIFDGSENFLESMFADEDEFQEHMPELFESGVSYEYFCSEFWYYADFSRCFNEAAKSICYAITELDSAGIIIDSDFEDLISPKEYNFKTDSINCEIKYNATKLQKYLDENIEAFTKYIKDAYTSRDGFSSWHSNDVNNWLDVYNYGEHAAGSVLQFVIFNEYENENDAIYDLYEESNCREDFLSPNIDIEKFISDFKSKAS